MGRQKGQSQRTKGNIRPSSSGRAASLLANQQGFIGFNAMSGDLGYVPVLKSLDDDDVVIDPDFRVVLSKLTKKDVTTKLKALAEFNVLCETRGADEAANILPYWPRIYNRLSEDADRRVRENAQTALYALVSLLGKKIAPYLKQFMGSWWITQCDSYAPASSGAKKAFQAAFPSILKQRKALLFCCDEILQAINSNIFMNLNVPQGSSKEDVKTDLERTISTGLAALASFLQTLEVEDIKQIPIASLERFYINKNLWKFAKHASIVVRASFYSLVSSFCCHISGLVCSQISTMCKCILYKLNESNPIVGRRVWEAAESLTASFDCWAECIDLRKGFLPQLWGMLKNGFHGNAKMICPHLLPLINQFPSSISILPIYEEMFKCLHQGVESETARNSSLETKAIVTTIFECMQLVLQKSIEYAEVVDWKVVDLVLQGQLFPILKKSLTEQGINSFFGLPLHQLFAQLVDTLSQKANLESIANQSTYTKVCSMIWKELVGIGKGIILSATGKDMDSTTFSIFLNFLEVLDTVAMTTTVCKKTHGDNKHVKFADTQQTDEMHNQSVETSVKNVVLHQHLQLSISLIIKHVLHEKLDSFQKVFILSDIFTKFADHSLFRLVSDVATDNDSITPEQHSPAYLFLRHFMSTIEEACTQDFTEREQKRVACLLNSCIRCCGAEVTDLLKAVYADPDRYGGKEMCIFLSQSFVEDEQHFVQSNDDWFVLFILNLAKDLPSHEIKSLETWKLLLMLLTGNCKKPLLQPKPALAILEVLHNLLEHNPAEEVAIEVNKINFLCFNTYVDQCDIADKLSEILTSGFLPLLKLAATKSSESLLSSIKDNVGSLLKACYNCETLSARRVAETVCKKGANFMTNQLFAANIELECITAFVRIITVFAEELVMHHMHQDYIAEWLDCVSPSESQMLVLRPPLESQDWIFSQDTDLNDLVLSRYFDIMQAYAEVSIQLSTFFSEVYHNVVCNPRLQGLVVEILLAKATASSKNFDIPFDHRGYSQEFMTCVLSSVVKKSAEFGCGWLLCFEQLCHQAPPSSQFDESLILNCISLEDSELSDHLVGTLAVFMKTCIEVAKVELVLAWALQKALDTSFDDCGIDNSTTFTQLLKLVVFALRRINELKNLNNEENNLCLHQTIVEKILEWKTLYPQSFLFDCDWSVAPSHHLNLNIAIIEFLECIIDIYPCTLSNEVWDFIECSFVSWIESCSVTFTKPGQVYGSLQTSMLNVTCSLMKALERFITSSEALNDPTLPVSLTTEWGEFFKPAAQAGLVPVFVNLAESGHPQIVEIQQLVGDCLESISSENLLSCSSRFETHLLPNSNLPNSIQTLLYHLSLPLLPSHEGDCSVRQVVAYSLLSKLAQHTFAKETTSSDSILPPEQLLHILRQLTPSLNETFSDLAKQRSQSGMKPRHINLNEDEEDEPDGSGQEDEEDLNDEKSDLIPNIASIQCFLLVWKLLVGLIHHIPTEARSKYTVFLNGSQVTSVSKLLSFLILLLPKRPFATDIDMNVISKSNMFASEVKLPTSASRSSVVHQLTCLLYKDILLTLPAMTRTWFNSLNKLERSTTDSYACKYVSPAICKDELDAVSRFKTPSGLEVKSRRQTREVVATYAVSEADFEILIELPANYPLTPPRVNTVRKAGVSPNMWRYWILQMTMLLHHQNGNILDALLLWKQKVDKRLDGLEECMICFSIVYGANAQSLPKLQCRTCKKKYHAECLYKWFDTSSQSTCPLCRSPMMFK